MTGNVKSVEFMDVEVLKADALILLCRIDRRVVGVPTKRLLPGTTIALHAGASGRIVISRELALNLGLLPSSAPVAPQ
jgi:hypothetical protein